MKMILQRNVQWMTEEVNPMYNVQNSIKLFMSERKSNRMYNKVKCVVELAKHNVKVNASNEIVLFV